LTETVVDELPPLLDDEAALVWRARLIDVAPRTRSARLARDSSRLTASLAHSLAATELIYCKYPPALILEAAERLIYAYQSRNKGAMRPAGVTEARASDAKSVLAGCFDAVKRHEGVSLAELHKGASAVLGAVKQVKIRVWLDVVRQYDDMTYQHCLLVAGLVSAFSVKLGLTPKHQHLLSQAALIHDVGKARIPPGILNKPGPLSIFVVCAYDALRVECGAHRQIAPGGSNAGQRESRNLEQRRSRRAHVRRGRDKALSCDLVA
jgi:hypothetical protein